jgi:hypothetical protein
MGPLYQRGELTGGGFGWELDQRFFPPIPTFPHAGGKET